MELIHIAQLVGIYMVIGLVFGAMYCSDNTSDDMQVDFFTTVGMNGVKRMTSAIAE